MADITGRDRQILIKALAYAIASIESLPPLRQEANDCADMKRILEEMVGSDQDLARVTASVRRHLFPELPS